MSDCRFCNDFGCSVCRDGVPEAAEETAHSPRHRAPLPLSDAPFEAWIGEDRLRGDALTAPTPFPLVPVDSFSSRSHASSP